MTHTPTPIELDKQEDATWICFKETILCNVTDVNSDYPKFLEHLVRCVNEREGLLNLLKSAANRLRNQGGDIKPLTEQLNWSVVNQIETVLAQAGQEAQP